MNQVPITLSTVHLVPVFRPFEVRRIQTSSNGKNGRSCSPGWPRQFLAANHVLCRAIPQSVSTESALRPEVDRAHESHAADREPPPQLAERSARELLDVLVAVRRGAADLRVASTIAEANAEDRLVSDRLSPVEGTSPSRRRTGTRVRGQHQRSRQMSAIRPRFSRYLSTTGPILILRQERQIVQPSLNLDDFLRAPWKGAPS